MTEDRAFPTLTAAQIARVAAHGRRRRVVQGDVLVATGDSAVPFLVVVSGAVEAVRSMPDGAEVIVATHHAGQFSGEGSIPGT